MRFSIYINIIKVICFIFAFFPYVAYSQSCDCQEYIYLNDPPNSEVNKFSLDPVSGITEIGAPWAAGISQPHGLGVDLNGYLYIGEFNAAFTRFSINKLDCEGNFIDSQVNGQLGDWQLSPDFDFGNTAPYSTNLVSLDGVLYAMGNEKIFAIDLCTGDNIGCIGVDEDWGMALTNDNQLVLTNGAGNANNDLILAPTDLSFYDASCTFASTFIVEDFVPDDAGNGNFNQVYGVTHAADGNYYVVVTENSTTNGDGSTLGASHIYRITPTGQTTLLVSDTANDGTGFYSTRGIIYSEDTGYLFLSAYENCIYAIDLNGNPAPAQFINTTPGEPKALSILKECCPTTTPLVYNEIVCSEGNGERVFLQEVFNCGDGIICEGTWSETSNGSGGQIVFNDCDLSITVNGPGCAEYTLSNTNAASQCGAFVITVNVCTEISAATLSTTVGTCTSGTPNNDAIIAVSSVFNADEANFSTGATYTGAAYGDASNIDISSGSGSITGLMHNTQYTVRVFNGANDCFMDYTVMTPTIDCPCTNPTITAFAISPSCTNNTPNDDGYLQISAASNATHYNFTMNSDYTGGDEDIANAIAFDPTTDLPLQFGTLSNPTGSQDYTIRVFNGASDCFTDVTVILQEQDCSLGCDCNDNIYLNDPGTNEVHKFRVLANGVQEIGNPWLEPFIPGGSEPIPSPHGIVSDLNGYLYIGEVSSFGGQQGGINQLSCDGTLLEDNIPNIPNFGYNLGIIGNNLYIPIGNEIEVWDICTGTISNQISTTIHGWGFTISTDQSCYYYASGWYSSDANRVFKGNADGSGTETIIYTGGTAGTFSGITQDDFGNLYVVENATDIGDGAARILKISPEGTLIDSSAWDNSLVQINGSTSGYFGARGIVWSSESNKVFVGSMEDCIAVFDSDLNYLEAESVGYVTGSLPKGIGIIKECCPVNNRQVIDQTYCTTGDTEQLFLNELFPCDGIVCEAQWQPVDAASAAIYETCDQGLQEGLAPGCYSFFRSSDGLGAKQCGAFEQIFNLEIIDLGAVTLSADQSICATDTPAALSVTTTSGGTIQWQISPTSCMAGFTNIAGANSATYQPGVLAETTYFRAVISEMGGCSSNQCIYESDCVTVSVTGLSQTGEAMVICNDNSTDNDPVDDYISFSLNPTGIDLGTTYTVTVDNGGTVTLTGGAAAVGINYGVSTAYRLQNGSADGNTTYTITITDDTDGTCPITTTVMQNNCSNSCDLTNAGESLETCNDNSTISDVSDDYITFNLNPVGVDLGTTYTVTVDNGGTVTLAGGAAAVGINYGASTAFRLQNGSADGSTTYTITVTDDADASCQITTTVMQDNCAVSCPIITNPSPAQIVCEGQTVSLLSINTQPTTSDIEFVYFTTQQSGNAMYSGGTSLATVSPTAGSASISNVGFPTAGTYYVYAILNPTPTNVNCRPTQEIIVTVQSTPTLNLTVSDTMVCTETNAMIWVYNSEIGVNYQLRNNINDTPVGDAVAGTGTAISFSVNELTPAGIYQYNVLATPEGTSCMEELTDLAIITVEDCDFTIILPDCDFPACHFTSTEIYLGADVNAESGAGDSDVDDGLNFPNNIRPGVTIRIPISIFNNTGQTAYLSVWIDWNGDGDYEDAGEQIASETYPYIAPNTGTFQVSLPTTVPVDAVQAQSIGVLSRLSSDPSIQFSPCGVQTCAADGEIENYLIQVDCPPEICLPIQVTINRN